MQNLVRENQAEGTMEVVWKGNSMDEKSAVKHSAVNRDFHSVCTYHFPNLLCFFSVDDIFDPFAGSEWKIEEWAAATLYSDQLSSGHCHSRNAKPWRPPPQLLLWHILRSRVEGTLSISRYQTNTNKLHFTEFFPAEVDIQKTFLMSQPLEETDAMRDPLMALFLPQRYNTCDSQEVSCQSGKHSWWKVKLTWVQILAQLLEDSWIINRSNLHIF